MSTDPTLTGEGQPEGAATAAWVTTGAVCFGGATLSATKLFALAEQAGWDASLAWLLFVILDGAAVAGGLVWHYGRTAGARRYGAAVLIESTVLSILGNVAAHLAEATGRLPMIVVLAVGAIVPIQIMLTVHMAMLMSERPADAVPVASLQANKTERPATGEATESSRSVAADGDRRPAEQATESDRDTRPTATDQDDRTTDHATDDSPDKANDEHPNGDRPHPTGASEPRDRRRPTSDNAAFGRGDRATDRRPTLHSIPGGRRDRPVATEGASVDVSDLIAAALEVAAEIGGRPARDPLLEGLRSRGLSVGGRRRKAIHEAVLARLDETGTD